MSFFGYENTKHECNGETKSEILNNTNNENNIFGSSCEPAAAPTDLLPPTVIQNVVSTVSLDCPLNLQKVSCSTRNSEYNPRRFCGVIMRIFSPKSTALIFSSGKVVVTGVKHEEEALLASRKYARIMQKIGFKVRFKDFKIHNIVATCDLKFPIRVENLHKKHGQFSSYEPELFPALIYRMIKPRVVLLIFVNGKVVITGAKSRDDISESLKNILPILRSFKK